uniref:Pecanex-like protein n=1 Tax=Syphacia muris TaxID=451379 RepID=A0A0N5AME7_9BILA
MIDQSDQASSTEQASGSKFDSACTNNTNDTTTFERNTVKVKNSCPSLPKIQKIPAVIKPPEAPLVGHQYDHETAIGREKFVAAVSVLVDLALRRVVYVSMRLLNMQSRYVKPYIYSSSSDEEEISDSLKNVML